jgi:hypothetical protein
MWARPNMTSSFDRRRFVLPMLVTMIVFFTAAKLLPPVETPTFSLAAAAGFCNRLYPLVAILLAGGLVMGARGLRRGAELPLRIGASTAPVRFWRWHLAAACLICVLQVSVFQTASQEAGYFGSRLALMDAHKQPYVDFEFAYGYAIIYVPYALHLLGFSIRHALVLTLDLAVVGGVLSIGILVERWIAEARLRLALFWALVLCNAFVLPGPALYYNFGRYAGPFALLLLLSRHGPTLSAAPLFVATAAANLLCYFLSAEMGIAFGAAGLAWLFVATKALSKPQLIAGAAAIVADLAGLILFARPMFTTFLAFREIGVILPVVPHIVMLVVVACFLTVCAISLPAVVAAWRGKLDRPKVLAVSEVCACAALAVALMPVLVGRTWPTTTIAYGFAAVVMAVGYFEAAGARRAALTFASLFIAFTVYCAQFVFHDDIDWIVARARARLSAPAPSRADGRLATFSATPTAAWRKLAQQFPNAYDPLAIIGYRSPHSVDVGYYLGVAATNAFTEAAFARKTTELQRALYYILPSRDLVDRYFSRDRRERALRMFARKSLFPYTFAVNAGARDLAADFAAMLYERCRPLANEGNITVCAGQAKAPP